MYIVVTYDVNTETAAGKKRFRHVAKACMKYGQRVQNSVFECLIDPADYVELRDQLLHIINVKADSLRIYKLGKNYERKIDSYGREKHIAYDGVMMI